MLNGFKLNGAEYDVGLSRAKAGYRLHVGGHTLTVKLIAGQEGDWVLTTNDEVDHIHLAVDGDDVFIHLQGETYQLQFEHALQRLAEISEGAAADSVRATMPGSLVSLAVSEGDTVVAGQTILVMESMKMETTIVAPRDGVIDSLHVAVGQTFDKDALLVTLASEAES